MCGVRWRGHGRQAIPACVACRGPVWRNSPRTATITRMRPTARTGRNARAIAAIAFAMTLLAGSLAGNVAAQEADKSDVVLVFDFSASILNDKTNRTRFADALERIAQRIGVISGDLIQGDTTVS